MLTDMDKQIDAWVEQWIPFIRKFARSLGLSHTDEDDWVQTARTVYWQVFPKFDESRGRSLDSYVLDMVKNRLLDMKRRENNQNRFWLHGSVPIDSIDIYGDEDVEELQLEVSKDSEVVLRLIYAGYSIREIKKSLGFPMSVINRAKDEAAKMFVEGGNQMMRPLLEERAKELGIVIEDGEDDLTLASRILAHGSTARRQFRVVPAPKGKRGRPKNKTCAASGCESPVFDKSSFCSLTCADRAYSEMKKNRQKRPFTTGSAKGGDFKGDESEEAIMSLENPFSIGTSAHEAFELFRFGGTKKDLAEKLDQVLASKAIKCTSPDERVRRVVTDTRRLGFELKKSKGGFFKLTGRKKNE